MFPPYILRKASDWEAKKQKFKVPLGRIFKIASLLSSVFSFLQVLYITTN